jgi:hypothetical protein
MGDCGFRKDYNDLREGQNWDSAYCGLPRHLCSFPGAGELPMTTAGFMSRLLVGTAEVGWEQAQLLGAVLSGSPASRALSV